MKLYALHDKKAKSLSSFFVDRADAVATRNFAAAVMQEKSVYGQYPDDFELVVLCDVSQDYADTLVDVIHVDYQPQVVVTARQVVDMQPKQSEQLQLLKEA